MSNYQKSKFHRIFAYVVSNLSRGVAVGGFLAAKNNTYASYMAIASTILLVGSTWATVAKNRPPKIKHL